VRPVKTPGAIEKRYQAFKALYSRPDEKMFAGKKKGVWKDATGKSERSTLRKTQRLDEGSTTGA